MYLDNRLVIPKIPQTPIKVSLHWGHPGRDQMLRQISDIMWPKIDRKITLLTKTCHEFQETGKSIKPILKEKQFRKFPVSDKINDEIAIDFAGPFKLARISKRYIIVSVDSKSGWPDAKLLRAPTTETVIEFLKRHIADNSITNKSEQTPKRHLLARNSKTFAKNITLNL